ncbi:MAG: hypothetical protein JW776_10890 [Candidatus Lokiarchaeota archaeon]|nr:hypothetical protein [Candidatus Lokiarchaeota archaeon]
MNVSEVGIILNGVSILYKQYSSDSNLNKINNDPDLRNALLDAILNMSRVVLSQNISTLNMKNYKIVLTSPFKEITPEALQKAPHLIFYGIGDKEMNVQLLSDLLEKIQEKFLTQFPKAHKMSTIQSSKFNSFLPVFDEVLQDLKETPSERFDHIF